MGWPIWLVNILFWPDPCIGCIWANFHTFHACFEIVWPKQACLFLDNEKESTHRSKIITDTKPLTLIWKKKAP
jgi:hypothetical protein